MYLILISLLSFFQNTVQVELTQSSGLSAFLLKGWSDAERSAGQWEDVLNIYVDSNSATSDLPPLSGKRTVVNGDLVFTPKYPLAPGVRYKAVVRLPGREPMERTFDMPKADRTPTTSVEHVYPSARLLPENQLKFYIHFSASMSRGEAYRRIHLLDESGKRVEMPFLELEQELWDASAKRLTLFFDPGRIKRDVLPNQEIGPSILAGHHYTLLIDKDWLDAESKPLKSEIRKDFDVGPADRKPLDIKSWKIRVPAAGTKNPLIVEFPEPLDHALMLNQLDVVDSRGDTLKGSVEIEADETRWIFKPDQTWKAGAFSLRAGTNVADLAGNMIDRPFEIDRFDSVTERITRETRLLPFTIKD